MLTRNRALKASCSTAQGGAKRNLGISVLCSDKPFFLLLITQGLRPGLCCNSLSVLQSLDSLSKIRVRGRAELPHSKYSLFNDQWARMPAEFLLKIESSVFVIAKETIDCIDSFDSVRTIEDNSAR
jgi:hypothetical protein